jgi:hypothetical protein
VDIEDGTSIYDAMTNPIVSAFSDHNDLVAAFIAVIFTVQ